ncbi:VWFA and cache domain-containing protein CG16868 [Hyalella azteca]|uniref:VWFA and cache domain-containing protein CG16868 n=1 Tax=Hyalella azteca TaxID=294128 RepID=A0A8B7NXS2_HYAAZ|nr:VWFA and cache domain-containing protein CG16868 [Hyalella azteca]
MALLDAAPSGGAPVLQKLSCARPWRGRRERRYRLTLPPGAPVASHSSHQPPGKWCVWYSLAAVPGTKLIFGVVNQTCDTATAFCPCSLVDRLCLNCQFVEAKACECPCECPTTSPSQCSTNSSSSRGNWRNPTQPEMLCPLDPPMPSLSHPQHVGLLGELQSCQTGTCGDHTTRHTCLGRPGCEWCSLTSPTNASENVWVSLEEPSCVPHPECPGGVKGGVSPYPRGLVPQPRHRESYRTGGGRSLPLAPVLGVMVGLVMVAGVGAAYCFHQHQGVMGAVTLTSRPGAPEGYTPAGLLSAGHVTTALEEELILDCQLGAAAMSPYRMNPAYRRPPAPGGDPSDPGYSTMTPHDDVPQRSSSSSSCLAIGVQSPSKNGKPSRDGRALLAKKRRPSRGLSSQPEEDCDENSSSPSGVFKGLASSSLLSGDHEPPTLDWSPEQLLQYFDDFDTGQCRHCNAPVSDGVCCNCEQTPCEECRSRPACQECHDSASCSRCRDQSSCPCKSKKRRRSRRRAGGGSVSDGIESDVASDGGCFANAVLTSPQKIGPNQVIVAVTVHMVDSL